MDTYLTLSGPTPEILFKEKHSKFFGYAYPIESEDDVKPILENLRKQHVGAVHFCYAWQLGTVNPRHRANDDGEPSHTAGTPIYGQIQSFGLTNVLVVVVRFFGGIKLGVGGLISAYRTAAQMVLEEADIVEKLIKSNLEIRFAYADLNKVMRIIKEKNLELVTQRMELDCNITVAVRLKDVQSVKNAFATVYGISVTEET